MPIVLSHALSDQSETSQRPSWLSANGQVVDDRLAEQMYLGVKPFLIQPVR